MKVNITTSFVNDKMELPQYAHPGDSGMDLQANLEQPVLLYPGTTFMVPTGVFVSLPEALDGDYQWEFQVRSKSGLAALQGLSVLNSPGTVDSGYRGEIKVILHNHGETARQLSPGQKIAQLVLTRCYLVSWQAVENLDDTSRGSDGFGSTGL